MTISKTKELTIEVKRVTLDFENRMISLECTLSIGDLITQTLRKEAMMTDAYAAERLAEIEAQLGGSV